MTAPETRYKIVGPHEVNDVTGTLVVIDVIRAFSVACRILEHQPLSYEITNDADYALEVRNQHPKTMVLGEVGGDLPPGFDYQNNPIEPAFQHLDGIPVIHRSSNGTTAVVNAKQATNIFCASFLNAKATVDALQQIINQPTTPQNQNLNTQTPQQNLNEQTQNTNPQNQDSNPQNQQQSQATKPASKSTSEPEDRNPKLHDHVTQETTITFCTTGIAFRDHPLSGDEDIALAEWMIAQLNGENVNPIPYLNRVLHSASGLYFAESPDHNIEEIYATMELNRFPHAIRAIKKDQRYYLQIHKPS